MCNEYNGYTNYETWLTALWIDNEQGLQETIQEYAQEAYNDAEASEYLSREEKATGDLAKQIEDLIDELNPLISDASLFSDMLNAAFREVDYSDIAKNFINEVDKEEEEVTE